jgi:hypothetical protein
MHTDIDTARELSDLRVDNGQGDADEDAICELRAAAKSKAETECVDTLDGMEHAITNYLLAMYHDQKTPIANAAANQSDIYAHRFIAAH